MNVIEHLKERIKRLHLLKDESPEYVRGVCDEIKTQIVREYGERNLTIEDLEEIRDAVVVLLSLIDQAEQENKDKQG